MLHETTDQFETSDGCRFAAACTKGDMFIKDIHETTVGYSYAMGVAPQILKHVFRSAKGGLGVSVPGLPGQSVDEAAKCFWVVESREACKRRLAMMSPERFEHLRPKDLAEGLDWEKKVGAALDESITAETKATGGDDCMDVRVIFEFSGPSVQRETPLDD